MKVNYSMTNEELAAAIAAAWETTRHVGTLHGSYRQVHEHYQRLLEIQQRRTALTLAAYNEIPEPTV